VRRLLAAGLLGLALVAHAEEPGQSEREHEHVAPDPPATPVHEMPYREMTAMMGMDDRSRVGKIMLDRVEWQDADAGSTFEWDAAAWYGGDFNKLRLETEGERVDGETRTARVEWLVDHIVSRWWSVRAGAREDFGVGPNRTWAGAGFAGTAPGMIDVEAMFYVGEGGRTALRLTTEYDLLVTQRLVLQPEAELDAYGRDDDERAIGAGFSDLRIGLRLRYELKREFAPYVGVRWNSRLGRSADLVRDVGDDASELVWVAGLRAWF
jgi:copper resistance protein B